MKLSELKEPSDIAQVIDLAMTFHRESDFADMDFDSLIFAETVAHCVLSESACAYVVKKREKQGESIIGFIGASVERCNFGRDFISYDQALYVDPRHRGVHGYLAAQLLLKAYIRWAQRKNAKRIFYNITAGINNQRAIDVIKRAGFVEYGCCLLYRGKTHG